MLWGRLLCRAGFCAAVVTATGNGASPGAGPRAAVVQAACPFERGGQRGIAAAVGAVAPLTRGIELEAVVSGFIVGAVVSGVVIVAGALAAFELLMLLARARRRNKRNRDELRAHVRRLGDPVDPGV